MTKSETDEQIQFRIRSAEREHDRQADFAKLHNAQVEAFANAAMRAPALVAAGGVAAALAFYSANYMRLKGVPGTLETFNEMLIWLFGSLLLTVAAPGLAYFSQLAYLTATNSRALTWTHPFVKESHRSRIYTVIGDICRWIAVLMILGSITLLIIAGKTFLTLVGQVTN